MRAPVLAATLALATAAAGIPAGAGAAAAPAAPTGLRVAYQTAAGDIATASLSPAGLSAATVVLPGTTEPALSPDGTRLAGIRVLGGHRRLILANADGSGARVAAAPAGDLAQPVWSPDGTRLALVDVVPGSSDVTGKVVVLDPASGAVETLGEVMTSFADDRDAAEVVVPQRPGWSPDGAGVLFGGYSGKAGGFISVQLRGRVASEFGAHVTSALWLGGGSTLLLSQLDIDAQGPQHCHEGSFASVADGRATDVDGLWTHLTASPDGAWWGGDRLQVNTAVGAVPAVCPAGDLAPRLVQRATGLAVTLPAGSSNPSLGGGPVARPVPAPRAPQPITVSLHGQDAAVRLPQQGAAPKGYAVRYAVGTTAPATVTAGAAVDPDDSADSTDGADLTGLRRRTAYSFSLFTLGWDGSSARVGTVTVRTSNLVSLRWIIERTTATRGGGSVVHARLVREGGGVAAHQSVAVYYARHCTVQEARCLARRGVTGADGRVQLITGPSVDGLDLYAPATAATVDAESGTFLPNE